MPKIRGVKPEMWTDDNFVELSPHARLLWIGLWNYACDNGHLQDKSKQIKMRLMPTDDINCAELLREIEAQQMIGREDGWITIHNLTHHQKPHKSWWATCDKPGCELPDGATSAPTSRKDRTAPPKGEPKTTVAQPLHNVEQPLDNRAQQLRNRCATADCEGDCVRDGEGEGDKPLLPVPVKAAPAKAVAEPDTFPAFWNAYDKKVGRPASLAAYKKALRKPGVTADLLLNEAVDYVDWLVVQGKHPEFTKNPTTWLRGEHWNDERSARESAKGKSRLDGFRDVHEELMRREAEQQHGDVRAIGGGR